MVRLNSGRNTCERNRAKRFVSSCGVDWLVQVLVRASWWGRRTRGPTRRNGRWWGWSRIKTCAGSPQAIVQIRDQEGNTVAQAVSDEAGEFRLTVPSDGTFSVSAVQDTYRSEYQIIHLGAEPPSPVTLTLSQTKEIALEVVSPLSPLQYKASSETYSLSRKEVEELPRGNNNELHDVLLTIPERRLRRAEAGPYPARSCQPSVQDRRGAHSGHRVLDVFGRHYAACLGAGGYYSRRDGGAVRQ